MKHQLSKSLTVIIRPLSTHLIKPNFHVSCSYQCSTTFCLETRILLRIKMGCQYVLIIFLFLVLLCCYNNLQFCYANHLLSGMYFFPGFSFSWRWGRYKWGKSSLGPKCITEQFEKKKCTSLYCIKLLVWALYAMKELWNNCLIILYVILWHTKLGAIIVCIGACFPFVAAKWLVFFAWFLAILYTTVLWLLI